MSAIVDTVTGKPGRQATREAERAARLFTDMELPSISDMELELEQLVSQGQISPEEAQAILVEANALDNIQRNPDLENAQLGALDQLTEIASSGGLDARAKARLGQISADEMSQEKGQRDAILQNAAQRGVGGSTTELMSLLANQQGSATRQSQRDMEVAALAEQRALDAIMGQGEMASNIRGQSFDEQARVADAQNRINEFNAKNRQDVNLTNVDARNQAQRDNLAERQRIADSNVDMANRQQEFNKGLNQQDYQNRMDRAKAEADARARKAQVYQDRQNQSNIMTGNLLEAGGKIASGGI